MPRGLAVPPELAPRGPLGVAPPRRSGSIRRTTTIDMTWVDGFGTTLVLDGRGRDLLTTAAGWPIELAHERTRVSVEPDRTISGVQVEDAYAGAPPYDVPEIVGARAGFGFRGALGAGRPDLCAADTPASLLLDDTPGACVISGWAFGRWGRLEILRAGTHGGPGAGSMENICTGFQTGSSALADDGSTIWSDRARPVPALDQGDDALAWHAIASQSGIAMRRARRLDVWVEGDEIVVDAMFQDSGTTPEGGREAVHEYHLTCRADVSSGLVTSLVPEPRVLPFRECPLAIAGVSGLVGTPIADLRSTVLDRLKGTAGCTHLNDAVRALAYVPELHRRLVETM